MARTHALEILQLIESPGIKDAVIACAGEVGLDVVPEPEEIFSFFFVFVKAVAPVVKPNGQANGEDDDRDLDRHFL